MIVNLERKLSASASQIDRVPVHVVEKERSFRSHLRFSSTQIYMHLQDIDSHYQLVYGAFNLFSNDSLTLFYFISP